MYAVSGLFFCFFFGLLSYGFVSLFVFLVLPLLPSCFPGFYFTYLLVSWVLSILPYLAWLACLFRLVQPLFKGYADLSRELYVLHLVYLILFLNRSSGPTLFYIFALLLLGTHPRGRNPAVF